MEITAMLIELHKTMSDAKIGKMVGVAQSTITRLRNGVHKTTRYEHGASIKRLYGKHKKNQG